MTQHDLITDIARRTNLPRSTVERALLELPLYLATELRRSALVGLLCHGTYYISRNPTTNGTHPRTHEPMLIPAREQISLHPHDSLRRALNPPQP